MKIPFFTTGFLVGEGDEVAVLVTGLLVFTVEAVVLAGAGTGFGLLSLEGVDFTTLLVAVALAGTVAGTWWVLTTPGIKIRWPTASLVGSLILLTLAR